MLSAVKVLAHHRKCCHAFSTWRQGCCTLAVDGGQCLVLPLALTMSSAGLSHCGHEASWRLQCAVARVMLVSHPQNRSIMLSRVASGAAAAAAVTAHWHMMHSLPPAPVTACRYSTASFSLRHRD